MTCKLPARFVDGRIFLHPRTLAGREWTFYTDTGGGNMLIGPEAVRRLGLTPEKRLFDEGDFGFVRLPSFAGETPLPLGVQMDGLIVSGEVDSNEWDAFLGQSWFAGRVWRFDYLRHELTVLGPEEAAPGLGEHACPLGFRTGADGERAFMQFPRVSAEIDEERLDFLFDTGARAILTPEGLNALGGQTGPRPGTSFITHAVFRRWRARHPDWRVIDHADATANAPMILVPAVRVAGHEVGPVWFTWRPDESFYEWMSQMMDKRIDGALGGSLFRYFSVTVDYPRAMAHFERPS